MAAVHPFLPLGTQAESELQMVTDTVSSKIGAAALMKIKEAERKMLDDLHELLTRLYVRNRNQHRRSHWFRSLDTFRKQLGHLLNELNDKRINVPDALGKRLRFWDAGCIHDWYLTFTQLVAANQFAVIGLVLMATVARVCRITGITDVYEDIANENMKVVLKAVDEGSVTNEFGRMVAGADSEEDLGEVIARDSDCYLSSSPS